MFAWRDISRGEEITIDYRLNAFGSERWRCLCGSHLCLGEVVNSFFAIDPERQRLYLSYAPAFIRRAYALRLNSARGDFPRIMESKDD